MWFELKGDGYENFVIMALGRRQLHNLGKLLMTPDQC